MHGRAVVGGGVHGPLPRGEALAPGGVSFSQRLENLNGGLYSSAATLTQAARCEQTVDYKEIYKANKNRHFQNLHKRTGIACEDMIFFDNENHNCVNVAPLGVTCVYTPRGMTAEAWEEGLAMHAKAGASSGK